MTADASGFPATAQCGCGEVQFRVMHKPMFVHCCHCTWCQRESGSAFALNAFIEAERVTLIKGAPELAPDILARQVIGTLGTRNTRPGRA